MADRVYVTRVGEMRLLSYTHLNMVEEERESVCVGWGRYMGERERI